MTNRTPFALTERLNALEWSLIDQYHSTDPRYGYNRILGGHGTSTSKKVLLKAFNKVFNELWKERRDFYSNLEEKISQACDGPVFLNEEQASFVREAAMPGIPPEYSQYIELSDDDTLNLLEAAEEIYAEEAFDWLMFSIKDLADIESSVLAREVESYVLSNATSILSEGIIQKVDKDGTVVKEYGSITDVMHDLNLSYTTNIYNVLEGRQKTAYGFLWRWKNKPNTE